MVTMNILLIGGGGREHCIAVSLAKSPRINNLHCIPGNAGTVSYTHLTLPTR